MLRSQGDLPDAEETAYADMTDKENPRFVYSV